MQAFNAINEISAGIFYGSTGDVMGTLTTVNDRWCIQIKIVGNIRCLSWLDSIAGIAPIGRASHS